MSKQKAFSILEMTGVLVIIALIIGIGITGNGLIKYSIIKSVINDFERFQNQVAQFKMQFGYFPGDFPYASKIWGTTCSSTATNCNGDGDGIIERGGTISTSEQCRSWQHLLLADISSFNAPNIGLCTSNGYQVDPSNAPQSNDGGLYALTYTTLSTKYSGSPITVAINIVEHGGFTPGGDPWYPILSALDSYTIDMKLDDGLPGSGNIISYNFNNPTYCATTAVYSTAIYAFASTAVKACGVYYILK